MKITGIIAEYNPFHNGHKYHLEEARRMTGADYLVVVISGDFVQRGAPAMADKYLRAEAALLNGADLVLELPLFYAAGSAEYFAAGAVTLLDRLGCVDALCFGSECGNVPQLSAIASILAEEPAHYRSVLQRELKNGRSYPKARSLAMESCLDHPENVRCLLSMPNNILGIEYMKTLSQRNSSIVPHTMKRAGNPYHDAILPCSKSGKFASASAIRSAMEPAGETAPSALPRIRPYVPESVYPLLENALDRGFPIFSDDFSFLLHYKLIQEAQGGFCHYLDVSNDLSDKICRNLFRFTGYEAFCSLLKTKDITYSRLSRSLLHILLNMTQAQMEEYVRSGYITYARILGFCKNAAPLLKKIKTHADIPVISKLADAHRQLSPTGLAMLEQDIQAAHVYASAATAKYRVPFVHELTRQLVIPDA